MEQVKSLFAAVFKDQKLHRMIFQSFDRRQVIEAKGFWLVLDQNVFRRITQTGLAIGTRASAVLDAGRLYFTSEHMVRRYLELDQYFHDATDEEIDDFAQHSRLKVAEPSTLKVEADRWTRTKIASIQRRKVLDMHPPKEVQKAGSVFGLSIKVEGSGKQAQIVFPEQKKEFKDLLRLLNDDLLDSELTGQKYEVNSKRRWP